MYFHPGAGVGEWHPLESWSGESQSCSTRAITNWESRRQIISIRADSLSQGDRERAQLCETLNFCEKG